MSESKGNDLNKNHEIFDHLENHLLDKKKNNKTATNTSYNRWNASYLYENEEEYEEMIELYQDAISKGYDFCLTEQHHENEHIPGLIDFDFKFNPENTDNPERAFTDNDIYNICKLYKKSYKDILNIPSEDEHIAFTFFVSYRSKSHHRIKNNSTELDYRDGFHIMLPNLVASKTAHKMVRSCVIKNFNSVRGDMKFKNTIDSLVDKGVINKVGWTLYGGSKTGYEPYKLRYVLNKNLEKIDADSLFMIDENLDLNNLPRYLSIRLNKNPIYPLSDSAVEISQHFKNMYNDKALSINNVKRRGYIEEYDIEIIRKLLFLLKEERYTEFEDWIHVVWCLHNINPEDDRLKELAIEFSKQSETAYQDGCVDKVWAEAKKEGNDSTITIKSLHYWAKTDDPNQYDSVCQTQLLKLRDNSLSATNGHVASFFAFTEENNFKYCKKTWFYWNKHRWCEDEESGLCIRNKIRQFIDRYYVIFIDDLQSQTVSFRESLNNLEEEDDEYDIIKSKIVELTKKHEKILHVISCLNTTSFKDNVVKECKELFHEPDFIDKLDTNPDLIGFENGIYDLKNSLFRDGCPEDYMSFSVGYNYREYDPNDPYTEEIEDFMDKIMPLPDVKEYQWKVMSSFLDGHNHHQKIRIWSGSGGNGKSILQNMLKLVLGQYCCKLNISLLTKKRADSGKPQPDIMGSRNKRWAYMDEPNDNDKLNIGLLKEITGGDTLSFRGLYDKYQTEFIPCFKLILCCNVIPKGPGADGGYARRVELVEFISRFVEHPNPNEPYEFEIDLSLKNKLEFWKESFMSMLLENYKTLLENNYEIDIPDPVASYTNEYIKENDRLGRFIEENIITVDVSNIKVEKDIPFLKFSTIHTTYEKWCDIEYGDNIPFTKAELRNRLETYFKGKWKKREGRYGSGLRAHDIIPVMDDTVDNKQTDNIPTDF